MTHWEMNELNTDIALSTNVIQSINSEQEFVDWLEQDYGYPQNVNYLIKKLVAKQILEDCIATEKYEFVKHLKKYL
jgi:hypothetical protein